MAQKKTISWKQAALIGLFTGIGTIGGKFAFNYFSFGSIADQTRISQVLMHTASEMNKNLPITLDAHTRLDTTIAAPDDQLIYHYTLLNIDIESLVVEEFVTKMRPQLINLYQTSGDMQTLREMDVTLGYSYHSEDGKELVKISISPDDFPNN